MSSDHPPAGSLAVLTATSDITDDDLAVIATEIVRPGIPLHELRRLIAVSRRSGEIYRATCLTSGQAWQRAAEQLDVGV